MEKLFLLACPLPPIEDRSGLGRGECQAAVTRANALPCNMQKRLQEQWEFLPDLSWCDQLMP